MKTVNDVKHLISVNETQEAIHVLQAILEDKSKSLQNQVILLESQFNEVQKKMQIGIMQESSELNRINAALLSICDDPKIDNPRLTRKAIQNVNDATGVASYFQNPMVKYGAIGVGVLILISIIANSGGGSDTTASNNIEQQSQMNAPLTTQNANNGSIEWHATPNKIILEEPKYNDIQVEIANISVTPENEKMKLVLINLKMICIDKGIDECWESDLKYIFVNPDFQVKSSVKSETSEKFKINQSWDLDMYVRVPIDMHNGSLDMYYLNKIKHTFQLNF